MRPDHPIALITGASSGIGEATARLLAANGYHLALGARRLNLVEEIAIELKAQHGIQTFAGFVDVRDSCSVNTFVDDAAAALGGLHVVVANAGLAKRLDRVEAISEETWQLMLHTNVEGVIRTFQAALPHLRASGWGHLFTIGSVAGHNVYENGGVYCASKHALRALIQALRIELCGEPIRLTSVDPGLTETNFSKVRLEDETKAKAVYQGMTPLVAGDIAECIRWALTLPDHVNIDELIIAPRDQASVYKVHRKM
jgi:NADP-dependent 3-hydroxy acid dehydrogenase YdfG